MLDLAWRLIIQKRELKRNISEFNNILKKFKSRINIKVWPNFYAAFKLKEVCWHQTTPSHAFM